MKTSYKLTQNSYNILHKIRDIHSKERVFILANGKSIESLDLSILKNEIVIGMNASTILAKQFNFRQNYYTVSDLRFFSDIDKQKYATSELDDSTIRIFRNEVENADSNFSSDRTAYVPAIGKNGFSKNLLEGYFFACTTTMLAIQLAYFIGSKEVYLLGCDLVYTDTSPRFYAESKPHTNDCFTGIQMYNIANSAKVFEEEGRKLISCSEHSLLRPYLEYKPFEEV